MHENRSPTSASAITSPAPSSSGMSPCSPPATRIGKPDCLPEAEERRPHQAPVTSMTATRCPALRSSSASTEAV